MRLGKTHIDTKSEYKHKSLENSPIYVLEISDNYLGNYMCVLEILLWNIAQLDSIILLGNSHIDVEICTNGLEISTMCHKFSWMSWKFSIHVFKILLQNIGLNVVVLDSSIFWLENSHIVVENKHKCFGRLWMGNEGITNNPSIMQEAHAAMQEEHKRYSHKPTIECSMFNLGFVALRASVCI